jgi:hypothetical protein
MSHAAGIHIALSTRVKNTVELLEIWLNNGWSFNDHNHISYLPLGDKDEFNWQHAMLASWPDIAEILKKKDESHELIGLVMTWKETAIGGEFLVFPDGKRLSINWNVNRRTLKYCMNFTDHSWYISRILPPLLKEHIEIESIQCYDAV